MTHIRPAREGEFPSVRSFYHALIAAMEGSPYPPGWEEGVYPSDRALQDAIAGGRLFLLFWDEAMAGAMIMDHESNESYEKASWPTRGEPEELSTVHALGVHPDFAGRGLGKALVAHAIQTARAEGQKAIRLDVLEGNLPALKLYRSMGFQYVESLEMFYEDTGWTTFQLFEYPL